MESPLIGRAEVLERLQTLLAVEPVVVLVGPPGAGTTTVARAVVPDARRHASVARGVDEGLEVLAIGLGLPGGPAVIERLVASDRFGGALVLDDATSHLPDALRAAERLGELGDVAVLVVAHTRPVDGSAPVVELGSLAPPEGVRLLRGELARLGQRAGEDDAGLARLSAALDHLPGALVLAARRLGVIDAARLAELVERRPGAAGTDSLARAVGEVWGRLPLEAREAAASLSTFAGAFDAEDAFAVAGAPGLDALQQLREAQLLLAEGMPPRLRLLRAARALAEEGRDAGAARRYAESGRGTNQRPRRPARPCPRRGGVDRARG